VSSVFVLRMEMESGCSSRDSEEGGIFGKRECKNLEGWLDTNK
jgi:hypothetical protein